MIPDSDIALIRKALEDSTRPIFFFDDDPDGICSFLLLYRFRKEGKGVILKTLPELPASFVRNVEDYYADTVFLLDKPGINPEFVEKCKSPIYWIDHHPPVKVHAVHHFNPRLNDPDDSRPTSYWCYKVVEQDLWLAMTGIVGDWQLTELSKDFSKEYPDLLPESMEDPGDALFQSKIGEISKIISFVSKGTAHEAMQYIKVLGRMDNPYELIENRTPRANFIHKRYIKIKHEYEKLLDEAIKSGSDSRFIVYTYTDSRMSFTGELSNELIYRFPDKVVILGRSRGGEMKLSLRSKNKPILKAVENSLIGIDGYGGGHENACGACVKMHDWPRFLEKLKEELE